MTSSAEGRQEAAVAVKRLEWSGPNTLADGQTVWSAIAEGMEFTYSIWTTSGPGDTRRFFCAKVLPQLFDSLEEAKAAVQQNYDDRILSALIPAKPAVELVEALLSGDLVGHIVDSAIIKCRALHDYAGRPAWEVSVEAAIRETIAAKLPALQAPATPDAHTEVEK